MGWKAPGGHCAIPGRGDKTWTMDRFQNHSTEVSKASLNQKQSPNFRLLWLTKFFSPPDVASDVVTSLPGASVTLTCPGEEPADSGAVHWVLASSQHRRSVGVGRRLLLRSVQFSDSGNYSCFLDNHLAGTVHLLVDGELCLQGPWTWLSGQLQCP